MSEFDDTSDMTDDECRQMLRVVAAERDALRADAERVARLVGALDFYACVDHYHGDKHAAPDVVQLDRGAKARTALGEKVEPVAWYRPSEEGYDSAFRDHSNVVACAGNKWEGWIPLYSQQRLAMPSWGMLAGAAPEVKIMNRDEAMSKPREVIARALHRADVEPRRFDPHWNVHEWDDLSDPAKVYWYRLAEAAIDAARGKE